MKGLITVRKGRIILLYHMAHSFSQYLYGTVCRLDKEFQSYQSNRLIPNDARTAIVDTNKQIVQASTLGNQLAKTTIDATVQNIRTFGENINAFVELNRSIIQSWVNPFTLRN